MAILDKEFLTFCNATNLDWHFLDMKEKADSSKKLHELLSPSKFYREYKDEKTGRNKKEYIYGATGETFDEENGLKVMQNSAGILMNYLEECDAGSKEGDFLKEWEVVYGADAYKLIVDELFIKTSKKLGLATPLEHPTREEVESNEKITYYIDVGINLLDTGISIFSAKNTATDSAIFASKKYVKKELLKHLVSEVKNKTLEEYEFGGVIGSLATMDNLPEKIAKTGKEATGIFNNFLKDSQRSEVNTHLKLTRKVDFSINDKFKVVIFKKAEQIVVVIDDKGLKSEKVLPSTIDLLQLLCCKIKSEFGSNVYFTGCDRGATLALLCNFLLEESFGNKYFFTQKPIDLNNYIDFTKEDIFEQYKSPYEVFVGSFKSGLKEIALMSAVLLIFTGGVGILGYAILVGLKQIISVPLELLKKISFDDKMNLLKNYGFITEKNSPKISGYITDRIYESDYIEIMTEIGYINIKSSHALFLIFSSHDNNWEKLKIYPDTAFSDATTVIESYRKNKKNVEYLVKSCGELYFHLVRGTNNTYEITGYKKAGENFYHKDTIKLDKDTSEKIKEAEYIISTMKITGRLQRAYKKMGERFFLSYFVNKEKIEKTLSIEYVNPNKSKYILESSIDEHIFLPYIKKDGNIGTELREDYIKSVFKDSTKMILENKTYSSSYLKSKKTYIILYEIMKEYTDKNIIPFYFYETVCKKDVEFFKSFVQIISYNENDNKAVIEMLNKEMKYDYNNKIPLTKERVELFIPIDIRKNSKFNDIANIILPPITITDKGKSPNNEVYCDALALNSHIKKIEKNNSKELSYTEKDIISKNTKNAKKEHYGYVKKVIKNGTYEQNYGSSDENKFRKKVYEDHVWKEHDGVDFSYGRQNPISCSHPRVYSPVSGIVKSYKNGKITIMNTENKKDYFGIDKEIPYYHIIENLHTALVKVKATVKKGQVIGTMGGRCSIEGYGYEYLQHVHYEIRVCRRYYTGGIKTGINPKKMKKEELKKFKGKLDAENRDRVIDPFMFWEKRVESGLNSEDDQEKKRVGGTLS